MAKERRSKEIPSGGGAGGKILALFLGILMGIIIILGALGGAAFYVYKSPIKKTVALIDGGKENGSLYQKLFGADGEGGFLSADYADKKVSDLLQDSIVAIGALTGNGSLADLEKVSPKVRSALQKLLNTTDNYGIPLDEDEMMAQPINKLGKYTEGQIKETPLSGFLKGFNGGEETTDKVMLALCYGEEGVDYVYDEEGNVQMLDGKTPTTLNELLSGGGATDKMNNMTLESIDINPNDAVMRTLAYGSAECYEMTTDEEGNVVSITMKQLSFTWDGAKMYDVDGKEVEGEFNDETLVFTVKDGDTYYLAEAPVPTPTAEEGEETEEPSTPPAPVVLTTYLAYSDEARETEALHKKKKVVDLTQNSSSLVDSLYLSDALNVNNASHKVLISLAYGSEENYTVDDEGKIHLKDGVKPRTIGELKTNNTELINGIELKDALNITPKSHRVLIALAYGSDYEINGDDITCAAGNTPRTLGNLSGEEGNQLINGIYLADALNVTSASDNVLITLAYGKKGRDYIIKDDGTFEMQGDSKPRTLEDLSGNIGPLLDDIQLADVMDPEFDDPIIMYLLYGRKGVHYEEIIENEKVVGVKPLQQKIAIVEIDGAWEAFNPYGEQLTGTFDNGKIVRALDYANKTYTVTLKEETEDGGLEVTDERVYYFDLTSPQGTLIVKDGKTATYYYLTDENGNRVDYEPTTLGDLSGENNTISMLTKRLTLEELLGTDTVNDNFFLKHVKAETIKTLPDAIEALTVTDVYAKDIYKNKKHTDDKYYFVKSDGDFFYDSETGKPRGNVDEDIPEDIRNQLVVSGTWWYLLHNEEQCHLNGHCSGGDSCGYKDGNPETTTCTYPITHADEGQRTSCIKDYKITELGALIDNMTKNMQESTLFQLVNDKIISTTANLDTEVFVPSGETSFGGVTQGTKLGALTVSQTLDYLLAVIDRLKNPSTP